MANLICSQCGKENHYSAYRGSKLSEMRSRCCGAPAAKGIMLDVVENNIHDVYSKSKKKLFIVNNRIQLAGYPKGLDFLKNDGEFSWFVEPGERTYRPSYISDDWIQYYKILNSDLRRIRYIFQEAS